MDNANNKNITPTLTEGFYAAIANRQEREENDGARIIELPVIIERWTFDRFDGWLALVVRKDNGKGIGWVPASDITAN